MTYDKNDMVWNTVNKVNMSKYFGYHKELGGVWGLQMANDTPGRLATDRSEKLTNDNSHA